MGFVCFDIETSNVFDRAPDEDLDKYAPFNVAVAATLVAEHESNVWLSVDPSGRPSKNMTRETAMALLDHLSSLQREGHALCAWNGASFDLRWIGFAADDERRAARLALDLYDPMFQFFNCTGYPVGLEAAAEGMKLGMSKTLKSEDAPRLWCKGEHDRVIEYVCSDVRITSAVVQRIQHDNAITWVTRKGVRRCQDIGHLKTVAEVLRDPEPDQSWMDTPIPRRKFVDWIMRMTR